jgi:hypothetical protein
LRQSGNDDGSGKKGRKAQCSEILQRRHVYFP